MTALSAGLTNKAMSAKFSQLPLVWLVDTLWKLKSLMVFTVGQCIMVLQMFRDGRFVSIQSVLLSDCLVEFCQALRVLTSGPPSPPQGMLPQLQPQMPLALTPLAPPLLLRLQALVLTTLALTLLVQPQQLLAALQPAQLPPSRPVQTHLAPAIQVLAEVLLAPPAATQRQTHLAWLACQLPQPRPQPLPLPPPQAGLCQRTCLLLQAHLPLAEEALEQGPNPSSSRDPPLGRCQTPLGSLVLAGLGVHRGVPSKQPPRLVHPLACPSGLELLVAKVCRVALADSQQPLVGSRLLLEAHQTHLAQTVALAHHLLRYI